MTSQPAKQEIINDFVITAIEGGYSWFLYEAPSGGEVGTYWYPFPFAVNEVDWGLMSYDNKMEVDFPSHPDAILIEKYSMTESKMWAAIQRLAYENKQTVEGLHENNDADSADVVMQYAVFGEVRYG